jgi:hypothetical protein
MSTTSEPPRQHIPLDNTPSPSDVVRYRMDIKKAALYWEERDRDHVKMKIVDACFFPVYNTLSYEKEYKEKVELTIDLRASINNMSYESIIYSIFGNKE